MAKAKKSKAKKSKAKKAKTKKAKKSTRRAAAASRGKAKTKAKKSKARKPKRAARSKPKAKAAKKAVRKAVPKKKKQIVGEGDYQASRSFLKDEAAFVKRHSAEIPAMGKDAEAALEGPEGASLRAAEEEARSHSKAPE
ncbi:MAG TPA: hypothetical protein VH019_03420 [Rhizomicrobium sp.]|jgi:hypothetical protein|nr:hypothetical protein [Rhizomicrobium sp.]